MKILHTSDWHLGKILHEHSLLEDQEYILNEILKILETDPHDAMIIAGDLYDRSVPPADAVKILSNFLKSLRNITDMPVLIIPGNHDSSLRLSYLSEIITIADIYITTRPEDVGNPVSINAGKETADIYLMPFLSPSAYTADEDGEESFARTHQGSVERAISKMDLNKNNLNILVGHLFTKGGKTSDSERKFIGMSGEIDTSIIENFDYVALGHLHKQQNPTARVYYSGTPLKYSFSESKDEKAILSIKITKKETKVKKIALKSRHDVIRIKGNMGNIMRKGRYDKYQDDYLEVELTDDVLLQSPIQELKRKFNNVLSVRRPESLSPDDMNIPETTEGTDIEDDFVMFCRFLHEDEEPDNEKMTLFREMREEAEDI